MPRTRRQALAVTFSLVMTAATGCQRVLNREEQKLDLLVVNYTTDRQSLRIQILDNQAIDHGDAERYTRQLPVPPADDSETAHTEELPDIIPRAQYLVRARLDEPDASWQHFHFHPGDFSTDPSEDAIVIRIRGRNGDDTPFLEFG